MIALEILGYIRSNDYIMDLLDKTDIEEAIAELEEAMKHKECCLICKDRSGCKFADNVRDNFGINSDEMWFSCFKPKEI